MYFAKLELDQIEEFVDRSESIEIEKTVTPIPNFALESSQSLQLEKERTEEPNEPYSDLI